MSCGCAHVPPPLLGGNKKDNSNVVTMQSIAPPANKPKDTRKRRVNAMNTNANSTRPKRVLTRSRGRVRKPTITKTTQDINADSRFDTIIEIISHVFSDYKNDPQKISKLVATSRDNAISNHISLFFSRTNIAISVLTFDSITGVYKNLVGVSDVAKGISNISPNTNIAFGDCEFVLTFSIGTQQKQIRIFKGQVIAKPDTYFKLFEVAVNLSEPDVSLFERYVYFWYILKTFLAPETILDIKLSDLESNANNMHSIRDANIQQVVEAFDDATNNPSAFTVVELPSGVLLPNNPAKVLDYLRKANPTLYANMHDLLDEELSVMASKMMNNAKHERISNAATTVSKQIQNFYIAVGMLAPTTLRFVVSHPRGGGKKTLGRR